MAKGKPTNMAASVHDRLLNLAKQRGEDFNFVLTRYAIERLMYRLGRSKHRDNFILKGATLFHVWGITAHRATKDVDLLGKGKNTPAQLVKVFREVIETDVDPDGLSFLISTLEAALISLEAEYKGVRVTMTARLGNARIAMQVDVGFGDAVVPRPALTTLPVLLDLPAPRIKAYAKETVVAEKLHAMVHLGLLNSRMKDYFDLWLMAGSFEFDGKELSTAIVATFKRRQTAVPTRVPDGISDEFVKDKTKQTQWAGFVRRVAHQHQGVRLKDVVVLLREFLLPILAASSRSVEDAHWTPQAGWNASR